MYVWYIKKVCSAQCRNTSSVLILSKEKVGKFKKIDLDILFKENKILLF